MSPYVHLKNAKERKLQARCQIRLASASLLSCQKSWIRDSRLQKYRKIKSDSFKMCLLLMHIYCCSCPIKLHHIEKVVNDRVLEFLLDQPFVIFKRNQGTWHFARNVVYGIIHIKNYCFANPLLFRRWYKHPSFLFWLRPFSYLQKEAYYSQFRFDTPTGYTK